MWKFFWAFIALVIINLPQGLDSWSNLIQKIGSAQKDGVTGMPNVAPSPDWFRDAAVLLGYLIFALIVTWNTRLGRVLRDKAPGLKWLARTESGNAIALGSDGSLASPPAQLSPVGNVNEWASSFLARDEADPVWGRIILEMAVDWHLEDTNSNLIVKFELIATSLLSLKMPQVTRGTIWIDGLELKETPQTLAPEPGSFLYRGQLYWVALRQYVNNNEMQVLMPKVGTNVTLDLSRLVLVAGTKRPDGQPGPSWTLRLPGAFETPLPAMTVAQPASTAGSQTEST